MKKYQNFFIWKFSFVGDKIFSIFVQACFRYEEQQLSLSAYLEAV